MFSIVLSDWWALAHAARYSDTISGKFYPRSEMLVFGIEQFKIIIFVRIGSAVSSSCNWQSGCSTIVKVGLCWMKSRCFRRAQWGSSCVAVKLANCSLWECACSKWASAIFIGLKDRFDSWIILMMLKLLQRLLLRLSLAVHWLPLGGLALSWCIYWSNICRLRSMWPNNNGLANYFPRLFT